MDLFRTLYYLQHLTLSPILATCVFCGTAFLLILLAKIIFFRSHPKKYLKTFEQVYAEKGSVLYALEQAKAAYPKRSKEAAAINAAILHLTERSILRDYPTAFRIIENTLTGKKVHALDQKVLEEEREKKSSMLLISPPSTK